MELKLSKVTIGIPVYNGGASLGETLESCSRLPEDLFRVIVSDNCSIDNTYDIAQRYASDKKNISVFRQDKNLGASNNFRFLLDACETEYFMWLAGDDVITSLDWAEIEGKFTEFKDAIAIAPYALVDNIGSQIPDRGNQNLTNENLFKNLLNFLWKPGVNSRFYSIYKVEALRCVHNKIFSQNLGNFYASDIVFSATVLSMGPWPLANGYVLSRKAGISSDGWRLRKLYASNLLGAIFPSARFIKLIAQNVNGFRKIFVYIVASILYMRYLIGPLRHRLSKALNKV